MPGPCFVEMDTQDTLSHSFISGKLSSVPEETELSVSSNDMLALYFPEKQVDTTKEDIDEFIKKHDSDITVLRSIVGQCFVRLQSTEDALDDWHKTREELVKVVGEQVSRITAHISERLLDTTTAVERSENAIRSELRREVTKVYEDMQVQRAQREVDSIRSRELGKTCADTALRIERLDQKLRKLDGNHRVGVEFQDHSAIDACTNISIDKFEHNTISKRTTALRRMVDEENPRQVAKFASLGALLDVVQKHLQSTESNSAGASLKASEARPSLTKPIAGPVILTAKEFANGIPLVPSFQADTRLRGSIQRSASGSTPARLSLPKTFDTASPRLQIPRASLGANGSYTVHPSESESSFLMRTKVHCST